MACALTSATLRRKCRRSNAEKSTWRAWVATLILFAVPFFLFRAPPLWRKSIGFASNELNIKRICVWHIWICVPAVDCLYTVFGKVWLNDLISSILSVFLPILRRTFFFVDIWAYLHYYSRHFGMYTECCLWLMVCVTQIQMFFFYLEINSYWSAFSSKVLNAIIGRKKTKPE